MNSEADTKVVLNNRPEDQPGGDAIGIASDHSVPRWIKVYAYVAEQGAFKSYTRLKIFFF
ncbi:hypothetical protein GCM10027288_10330 [Bordetella tumbae]